MQLQLRRLCAIKPYKGNPRLNEKAVKAGAGKRATLEAPRRHAGAKAGRLVSALTRRTRNPIETSACASAGAIRPPPTPQPCRGPALSSTRCR
jgi:hypothetical protein